MLTNFNSSFHVFELKMSNFILFSSRDVIRRPNKQYINYKTVPYRLFIIKSAVHNKFG